jgi:CheY-like chemotaxis protein
VVGQGTAITLLLPRSHEPAHAHGPGVAVVEPPPLPPEHCILLVEDDSEVAALVGEMLRSIGYEVVHAASAAAALGALANGRKVDLVFSDIMMPGGTNGVELAREVRRRRADLPILLTSGFSEAVRKDADALGIPVLSKPYGLQELRAAVEGQLAGYAPALQS